MSKEQRMINRYTLCIITVLLAGCGGSQVAPTGGTATDAASAAHGKSWTLPEAKSQTLMYAADYDDGVVYVYHYLRTSKYVGALRDLSTPYGLCSDQGGNVFVTGGAASGTSEVLEYAHGGTSPIATLQDGEAFPAGCAIDSATENLAVANVETDGSGSNGDIVVYQGAQGTPTEYSDTNMNQPLWCTYDNAGNLYVEGVNTKYETAAFAVLKKGSETLEGLDIAGISGYDDGGIAWDGKYLVVAGARLGSDATDVYQVQLSGLTGKIVNTVTLDGFRIWGGMTIFANHILMPIYYVDIGRWKYPQGGEPTRQTEVEGDFVPDQTISVTLPK
jgi:hypothetical protein